MSIFSRSSGRVRGRDGSRQVWAIAAFAAGLAGVALAVGEYAAADRQATVAAAASGPSDREIYTGSILYMPDEGNICRQLLFDNRLGLFTDNGYVDCESAAYQGGADAPKRWSAARVRVIASGFRQH